MLDWLLDRLRDPIWVFFGVVIAFVALILAWPGGRVKIAEFIKNLEEVIKALLRLLILKPFRLASILIGICLVIVILFLVFRTTPSPLDVVGRSIGHPQSFSIGKDYYYASGKMGDIGDIDIAIGAEADRFTYEALGREPHEWDWKYRDGKFNPEPAQFAGVMYLDPPNNWGEKPGFDFRGNRRLLKWEARSVTGAVIVEFIIGGVDWVWDKKEEGKKVRPLYPDSMPRTVVGRATLTENWQSFTYDLTKIGENNFQNLIGGFSWVITWGSNGVQLNQERKGPVQARAFIIEIRNICYER